MQATYARWSLVRFELTLKRPGRSDLAAKHARQACAHNFMRAESAPHTAIRWYTRHRGAQIPVPPRSSSLRGLSSASPAGSCP